MKTITIDILNEKVLNLLRDLEQLKLIRLRKVKPIANNEGAKFKGAMTKESINEIDRQLKELRSEWVSCF